jgi:hypothetical protein
MRKIREVLHLTFAEGLSRRLAGIAAGMPTTTVADYVARAQRGETAAGLSADFAALAWLPQLQLKAMSGCT